MDTKRPLIEKQFKYYYADLIDLEFYKIFGKDENGSNDYIPFINILSVQLIHFLFIQANLEFIFPYSN